MFSLGRYLYHLPTVWVAYDAENRQFTAQAKAKLEGIVALHYQRTLHPDPAEEGATPSADEETTTAKDDEGLARLHQQFEQLGSELYGEEWAQVCRHNVERISQGQTGDAADLTLEQLQKLIDGLKQLKRKRRTKRAGPKAAPAAG
jgi:hypothetical protein